MTDYLSPKQLAMAIGVSEASVKRWCDRGLIRTTRTAGGHRRLARADVLTFLRADQVPIIAPQLLGLPSMTGVTDETTSTIVKDLKEALVKGDRERVRRLVLNFYMSGNSAAKTFDEIIAPAFYGIGEKWKCGEVEIYEERRGTEITMSIIRELDLMISEPQESVATAICTTLKDDYYEIPLGMVATTLREAQVKVEKIGVNVPRFSIEKAVEEIRPRLVCISTSFVKLEEEFLNDMKILHQKVKLMGATLIIGGQALSDELRQHLSYDIHCDNLSRLTSFVSTLKQFTKLSNPDQ